MPASAIPYLTPEQYLTIERESVDRHEYYRGQMQAMAGGTPEHSCINTNVAGGLWQRLLGKTCAVHTQNMRLSVGRGDLYTYPDVMVVCGVPRFLDHLQDVILNPVAIIEILSASTEAYDRDRKFMLCRGLESLQEYVLISQAEPIVERFTRQVSGKWDLITWAGLDQTMRLDSIDCDLPLAQIYEKVKLED